jgi:hypothetical protein
MCKYEKGQDSVMIFDFINTGTSCLVGYLIALWQNRRSDKGSKTLQATFDALPQQFVEALRKGNLSVSTKQPHLEDDDWPSVISFADVDNDGKQELLVQYLAGAHGNSLQIFGWRNHEYVQIARIGVGVPVPFEFGDFVGDGKIEILGKESDWDTGLPYSLVPRHSFRLRWNGQEFAEVWRSNDYTNEELAVLRERMSAEFK